MAILKILEYPDPRLHRVAAPVSAVTERIAQLAQDMLQTMYQVNGVGLAATQVDVHERVLVMDVSESRDHPVVLINPELLWSSDASILGDEGCLSIPGVIDKVSRHAEVHVRAMDEHGASRVIEADGLLSICIQHEMDHLMGKVFVERLSALKRKRVDQKLHKRFRSQDKQRLSYS